MKWQQIQGEVAQEYDVVKNIMQTLNQFKGNHHDTQSVGPRSMQSFEEPTRDPDVWPAPAPKDPQVWDPPTHSAQADSRGSGGVRPVRGPRKSTRSCLMIYLVLSSLSSGKSHERHLDSK